VLDRGGERQVSLSLHSISAVSHLPLRVCSEARYRLVAPIGGPGPPSCLSHT
jgi:hypothetical protein